MVVSYVPLVRALIESINELLAYDSVKRRIFGIHLTAHLVEKVSDLVVQSLYPMASSQLHFSTAHLQPSLELD